MRLRIVALVLGALAGPLFGGLVHAEDAPPPGRPLKDLHYGAVLFDFYQQDYFRAMAELIAQRQMGRTQAHAEDGELLLGGMLLSYGQHQQAAEIFQRLMNVEPRIEVRNRAWFYLARISYQRGALDQARAALARMEPDASLPAEMDAERRVLAAQILIREGRYDEAARALAEWKGPKDWDSFARFNLGVALVRAQRVEEGGRYLEQVGTQAAGTEEQLAVRDRANVALGYASMQAGKPEEARAAFQRVRLQGPSSTKALLGLGWADSARGEDRKALVPWKELAQRDLLDPAVQESLLAIPYATARLKRPVQAAQGYETAISTYAAEIGRLDAAIGRIRQGEMIRDLLKEHEERGAEPGASWRLEKLPQSEETRYLYLLMATDGFQETLRNYRDLSLLKANLAQWKASMPSLSDIVAEQATVAASAQARSLPDLDVAALRQRREELAAQLSTAEAASGVVDAPEAVRVRRTLNETQLAISALEDRRIDLQRVRSGGSGDRHAEFQRRVDEQSLRVDQLSTRLDAALAQQAEFLQTLAVRELSGQQRRLQAYTDEARFALARVYDTAVQARQPETTAPAPGSTP